jgi:Domain of unknown function (DUF4287)
MTFQAYLDNIHQKTGKTPDDLFALAKKTTIAGPELTAGRLVAWLKSDFGLGHGHAMAIWAVFKSNGWAGETTNTAKLRKAGGAGAKRAGSKGK